MNYGKSKVIWKKNQGRPLLEFLKNHQLDHDFIKGNNYYDNFGTIWLEDGSWINTKECSESSRMYWRSYVCPPLPK